MVMRVNATNESEGIQSMKRAANTIPNPSLSYRVCHIYSTVYIIKYI